MFLLNLAAKYNLCSHALLEWGNEAYCTGVCVDMHCLF